MKQFSVIGYYEENGQTFLDHVDATNGRVAMSVCASDRPDSTIVCALEGHVSEGAGIDFAGEGVVDAETILEQPDVFS